jgi:8-oxo-dGTP diphosphatase
MKHLDVVAAIIIHNKQILCMQRGKAKYEYVSYKYEFPGGKIEKGETRTQALMRELREEMNISIKIFAKDYFLTVNHAYPDFGITLHSYLCPVDSREFVRQEHVNHKWVYPEDLSSLDWAEADLPIVEKIMEMMKC